MSDEFVKTIEDTMAELAQDIVKNLKSAQLPDKIDAMKVMTAYYVATKRYPPGKAKKTDEDMGFEDFAAEMHELNSHAKPM